MGLSKPLGDASNEQIPGAGANPFPEQNLDAQRCVSATCANGTCQANVPSTYPVQFSGLVPSMFPTKREFKDRYPGCVCHSWRTDEQIMEAYNQAHSGEPHADVDDAAELAAKMAELQQEEKSSEGAE